MLDHHRHRRVVRIDLVRRRLWLCGFRFHHAHFGFLLLGACAARRMARPLLLLAGAHYVLVDWADRPWLGR